MAKRIATELELLVAVAKSSYIEGTPWERAAAAIEGIGWDALVRLYTDNPGLCVRDVSVQVGRSRNGWAATTSPIGAMRWALTDYIATVVERAAKREAKKSEAR